MNQLWKVWGDRGFSLWYQIPLRIHASTEAMQAEKGDSSSLAVDEDGTRVQAAKAAEEALRLWKGWKKDSSTSQALYNSAMFPYEHPLCSTSEGDVAIVYLAGVPARSARERHQVKPGVVRLVNEGQTFSVTRGDSSRAYPKRVLLDTGAQPVMLGRRLANELSLVPHDLDPCPFTIATSLGAQSNQLDSRRNLCVFSSRWELIPTPMLQ